MRSIIVCFASVAFLTSSQGQQVKSIRTLVGSSREIGIEIQFDSHPREKLNSRRVSLQNGDGERVYCSSSYDTTTTSYVRYLFEINSANFTVFERLVSDSSGYFLENEDPILLNTGVIERTDLKPLTKDRIPRIKETNWNEYVLNEYSSQFLFPHQFKVGTRLGLEDSSKTVYFIDMVQSGDWANTKSAALFWGLKGRWSTDRNDKLNYVQFYPLTILFPQTSWRVAASTGVETGYQGFGKLGRGTLKGEVQFRLPFNPVDLTLGMPRWRINPVVNLAVQGNVAWANVKPPDSLKNSLDASVEVRYDMPVARSYYLQTKAKGYYSTVTKQFQYQYEFSLGYIAEGNVRIMAYYKQGFQEVSYQFDRQLLLGFAFDMLNQSVNK
jgi:hypothetical protein